MVINQSHACVHCCRNKGTCDADREWVCRQSLQMQSFYLQHVKPHQNIWATDFRIPPKHSEWAYLHWLQWMARVGSTMTGHREDSVMPCISLSQWPLMGDQWCWDSSSKLPNVLSLSVEYRTPGAQYLKYINHASWHGICLRRLS